MDHAAAQENLGPALREGGEGGREGGRVVSFDFPSLPLPPSQRMQAASSITRWQSNDALYNSFLAVAVVFIFLLLLLFCGLVSNMNCVSEYVTCCCCCCLFTKMSLLACWPLPLLSYLSYMYCTPPQPLSLPSLTACHPPLLLPPLPPLPSPSILSSHFPLGSPTSTPPPSDRPANNHPSTHTHLFPTSPYAR